MKNDNLDHENRPVKYGVTPSDLQQMQQRRIEQHEQRRAAEQRNLDIARVLGPLLNSVERR